MKILKLADYQIVVGDIWASLTDFLNKKKYSKIIVLVDENTEGSCFQRFRSNFPNDIAAVIKIPSGELNKTIETCQQIWCELFAAQADRNSVLICIGGGVIGDMGGFSASTFKRGIDFIQMPTTLLSQVDSSIGGKLGIDFHEVKNSIGVFANPKAVFISPDFLTTVSAREVRSGFGEIIKHALIADAKQWAKLSKIKDLTQVDWTKILVPSLKIKQHIVKVDPFERGVRKALNFGHTIGHAVESMALTTQNPLTHGEAIAIGMICEAYLSRILRGLSDAELTDICQFILATYGKYDIKPFHFEQLIALMRQDKKNDSASKINFSLLPRIGSVEVNCIAVEAEIEAALCFYKKL
ncbi:MAG: 3-dehydroquinate synthase [Saprospiraceae bacterium]|nr:3-dehydroquinate synthase [Saprospiraceae bacterium]